MKQRKNLLSKGIVLSAVCCALGASSINVMASPVLYGDVTGDGIVDTADYTMLNRYLIGKSAEINTNSADVNLDGIIDTADQMLIKRYLVGKIQSLPVYSCSPKVEKVLKLITQNEVYTCGDKQANRDLLKEPLKNLSFEEVTELMGVIRQQGKVEALVNALISIDSSATNQESLIEDWVTILSSGKLDYMVEILTYTNYRSAHPCGYYCFSGDSVYIGDYAAVNVATIIHESNHSFNEVHGLGGNNGLNEGTSITICNYFDNTTKSLAESIFGTVLYYRDIKLAGYPTDLPIYPYGFFDENGNVTCDEKGKQFINFLMSEDVSRIDWFNPLKVQTIFDRYWKPLNRNMPFSDWLVTANAATEQGWASGLTK
jgi:hypothetical protein